MQDALLGALLMVVGTLPPQEAATTPIHTHNPCLHPQRLQQESHRCRNSSFRCRMIHLHAQYCQQQHAAKDK